MKLQSIAVAALTGLLALPLTTDSAFAVQDDASGGSQAAADSDEGGDECKITPADGSATFTIPKGATGYSYEVLDWDPLLNDLLNVGSGKLDGDLGGAPITIPFGLRCEDGEIVGDAGSSWESECSVFVRVTFTFPKSPDSEEAPTLTQDSGYIVVTVQ